MSADEKPESAPVERNEESEDVISRRERLVRALNDVEGATVPLQDEAQKVADLARRQRDLAYATKRMVLGLGLEAFADSAWEHVTTDWEKWNEASRRARYGIAPLYNAMAVQYSSTATSTSAATVSTVLSLSMDVVLRTEQFEKVKRVSNLVTRSTNLENLHRLFRCFGLDKYHADIRSPDDLMQEAYAALRLPSREDPSPSSILIPAREAIWKTVDALLKRLPPPQEQTKGVEGQITLIGRRCAGALYSASYFEHLGASARTQIDKLHEGKDRKLTRDQLLILFDSVVHLLTSLLDGIDVQKLRTL